MKLNPFQAYRDYSRKREVKAGLLAALRTVPAGAGVDLPNNDPVIAAALTELLRERADLVVTKHSRTYMLCRRRDFVGGVTGQLREKLEQDGHVAERGEDLGDTL